MALVQMNCKNCGAPLERQGDAYVCPHCGSRVLDILDASVEAGADIVTPAEFGERLKAQKTAFVVDFGDTLRAFDAQTEAWNAQLRQALRLLQARKDYAVEEALRGVPDTLFAAERLRLLADVGARDEAELACWSGDLRSRPHFERVCATGDFEQKRLYERIAEECAENARIGKEIARGKVLLDSEAFADAERYAAVMCAQYPTDARAWELLIAARCGKDGEYDPQHDLSYFFRCPNCEIVYGVPLEGETLPRTLSPAVRDRVRAIASKKGSRSAPLRKVLAGVIVLAGIGVLALVWALIEALVG